MCTEPRHSRRYFTFGSCRAWSLNSGPHFSAMALEMLRGLRPTVMFQGSLFYVCCTSVGSGPKYAPFLGAWPWDSTLLIFYRLEQLGLPP